MSAESAAEEEKIYTDAFLGDRSWNGRERNQLLWNRGDGSFLEVGAALGLDSTRDPRGLAASDFDHDGDIDFVVNNYRAPAELFQNQIGQDRSWIALRLRGTRCNRDGIGATLRVHSGPVRATRVVGAGHGYQSQYSLEQVVGLGSSELVQAVEVRWPGGEVERFGPFAPRQRLTLVQGEGRTFAPPPPTQSGPRGRAPASVAVALAVLALFFVSRAARRFG